MRFLPPVGSTPLLLLVLLVACAPEHRDVQLGAPGTRTGPTMPLGASTKDRFGLRQRQPSAARSPSAQFEYDLPDGWSEAPASDMRQVNLTGPGITSWVTQLGPGAGGVLDNVNRWRTQMGLAAVGDDDLEELAHATLLGQDALSLDLIAPDRSKRLVGRMLFAADRSVFVRITGTADDVEAQLPAFEGFVGSLADAEAGATRGGGLAWSVPDEWQPLGDDQFRTAHYQVAPGVRIWSSVLGGDGGGEINNIRRWVGQYGQSMLRPEEIDALETIEMLGTSGKFVDLTHEDEVTRGMFGVMCPLGDKTVFVKMDGPSAAVRAHEAAFRQFCAELRLD